MAATPVIGLSPVTFLSEDANTVGSQFQIPLAVLKFDSKGVIDPSDWPPVKAKKLGTKDSKLLPLLLADLLKRGILSAPSP
ncbi:hypothetical protein [Novosphingobium lentum]|uniref:hypothetical protein n=1 Tax=Novosphingobium lentum TaxID=145287 RepID=UPI000B2DFAAB|nr:hypothetical protein [Novosphingobium lentum]